MPTSNNPARFDAQQNYTRDCAIVEATEPRSLESVVTEYYRSSALDAAAKLLGSRYTHLIAEYEKNPGGFPNRTRFPDWLNQHGQQGWQLVAVHRLHSSLYECFFVRPVME